MKLFDSTLTRLEHSLDVRLARHNVLSGNVANVDTPGFSPKDIDFKAAMAAAAGGESASSGAGSSEGSIGMAITDHAHMGGGGGSGSLRDIPLTGMGGESPSLDGNKVDLDRTMVALAENGMQYGASARAAGRKLAILRYVVSDGQG
jgi:flagellar basal-body rod protein FlgB